MSNNGNAGAGSLREAIANDVTYVIQESIDLINWTEVYRFEMAAYTETVSDPNLTTAVDPGSQTITVTDGSLNPVTTFGRTGVIHSP